ncbi:MAG: Lipoprotein [Thermoanaerobacterium thermosaccharolyticum]
MIKSFRTSLAVVFLLLMSVVFSGCSETVKNNTEVPFVVLNDDAGSFKADIYYWNVINNKIKETNENLYKIPQKMITNKESYTIFPIAWDGHNHVVLPSYLEASDKFNDFVEKADFYFQPKTIWGQDVKLVKSDEENRYKLTLIVDGKTEENEITIPLHTFKGDDGKEYEATKCGTVTSVVKTSYGAAMLYPCFTLGGGKLFILKYDSASESIKWQEVGPIKGIELSPSFPPLANRTATIGENFIVRTQTNPIEVYTEKVGYKIINNISDLRKKYASETLNSEFPEYIDILGSYNDILFLSIPVHKNEGTELYIFAVKDDKLIGIMHRTINDIEIIDTAGNVVSKYNMPKAKTLIGENDVYFPNVNGMD